MALSRSSGALGLALIAFVAASSPARARADLSPEAEAARRDLIVQAEAARDAGRHDAALDLAERAGTLRMSVSLRRFIAEESLASGDSARALGSAELCVREAAATPDHEHHGAACQALVEQARARVGYIVVKPVTPIEGLTVRAGLTDIPPALFGERFPVTPGDVDVQASGPHRQTKHLRVHVEAGSLVVVDLDLPSELVSAPPVTSPGAPVSSSPAPASDVTRRGLSPLVPVGAGAAFVGVGVAAVVYLVAKAKLDDYRSQCVTGAAPPSCTGQHDSVSSAVATDAVVIDVSLVVAAIGAAVGVGAWLWPAEPRHDAGLPFRIAF